MKVVDLDLEKDQKLDSLSKLIKNKKIRLGEEKFQLKIHSYNDVSQLLYASFLLLLAIHFIYEKSKKEKGKKTDVKIYDKQSEAYYNFYIGNDVKKLETKIEKDFNVNIELEKKDPIDDVFGIWKNQNINLEKIREKAWRRTK